jgi:hypothetical protein
MAPVARARLHPCPSSLSLNRPLLLPLLLTSHSPRSSSSSSRAVWSPHHCRPQLATAQHHRSCSRPTLHSSRPLQLTTPPARAIIEVRGLIWPAFLHRRSPELGSAWVSCSTASPPPFSRAPASPHGDGALASLQPPCRALERRGRHAAAPPCAMLAGVLAPASHPAKPRHQSVWLGVPSTLVPLAPPEARRRRRSGRQILSPAR